LARQSAGAWMSIVRMRKAAVILMMFAVFSPAEPADGYSVMSHQAIIDSAWEEGIKPALHKRFPDCREEELQRAKAYSYGGAIIQDLGYYPAGNPYFSDLTHYVRSGDFVQALLRDAQSLEEYAFALGALAHYAADNKGHRLGTNRAVPVLYPKLKKKYGDSVSYEEDKLAHVKTEFGFDVLEVAKQRYAPQSYHDFIGFQVAPRVLEQAFQETYGLDLKKVLKNEEHTLNSYRHAVSSLLPRATRIAWDLKKDDIQKDQPGITKSKFLYNLKRASYESEWGKDYQRPTVADRMLAFLYKILPKVGPLKVLQFKTPTPETERMFEASFNETLDQYRQLLAEQRESGKPDLKNENFDLGVVSGPGQYKLNDTAHAKLLDDLAEQKFSGLTAEIRGELLQFFAAADTPFTLKKDKKAWAKLQSQLDVLKNTPAEQKTAASGNESVPADGLN
jgi:zinc dependent phospholipase C